MNCFLPTYAIRLQLKYLNLPKKSQKDLKTKVPSSQENRVVYAYKKILKNIYSSIRPVIMLDSYLLLFMNCKFQGWSSGSLIFLFRCSFFLSFI